MMIYRFYAGQDFVVESVLRQCVTGGKSLQSRAFFSKRVEKFPFGFRAKFELNNRFLFALKVLLCENERILILDIVHVEAHGFPLTLHYLCITQNGLVFA